MKLRVKEIHGLQKSLIVVNWRIKMSTSRKHDNSGRDLIKFRLQMKIKEQIMQMCRCNVPFRCYQFESAQMQAFSNWEMQIFRLWAKFGRIQQGIRGVYQKVDNI